MARDPAPRADRPRGRRGGHPRGQPGRPGWRGRHRLRPGHSRDDAPVEIRRPLPEAWGSAGAGRPSLAHGAVAMKRLIGLAAAVLIPTAAAPAQEWAKARL